MVVIVVVMVVVAVVVVVEEMPIHLLQNDISGKIGAFLEDTYAHPFRKVV